VFGRLALEKQADGLGTLALMGLTDGREGRAGQCGLGDVVEARHRDIGGHADPAFRGGVEHAEGETVGQRQNGGRTVRAVEQLGDCAMAGRSPAVRRARDGHVTPLDACRLQAGTPAGEARRVDVMGCRRLGLGA
jgi:hypothetical protein